MTSTPRPLPATASSGAPPTWLVGQAWAQYRLRQPGWLVLPLRVFLGVTFLYASLQKLANPTYLDPSNSQSVVGQMRLLRHASPIGPLLGLSLHAPTLVGLLIAFGELAVAVGALLGLWTRFAALGGMALSLTFFLTVSWQTRPYYYGSDIVFLFAWSVLAALGSGGVLSLDGVLDQRARLAVGSVPVPAVVSLEVPRLREICPRADKCGLRPSGVCTRQHCAVFPGTPQVRPDLAARTEDQRRQLATRATFLSGLGAVLLGGLAAWFGRLAGGTSHAHRAAAPVRQPSASPSPRAAAAPGTAIGSASAVPVGQAGQFTDPATGNPSYVVHPSAGTFVAFSAVCTHAGCTVNFDPTSMQFVCPCHGGTYDAHTGQVLGGPPPAPLASIPVHVVDGQIRVD